MRSRSPLASQVIRFGTFEVDLSVGELRKNGVKIKLQEQPFQVLVFLINRPGEVVTRGELRQKLWPEGTFVDFEHGLNAAVNRLRDALGDTADNPRFVETIPRRGYRFIASVEEFPMTPRALGLQARSARLAWRVVLAIGLLAVLAGLSVGELRERLMGRVVRGDITSIAVLPLENLSGDPEQDPFVDGMTEELITQLSKLSAMERVISRHSAMQYKGTTQPLSEVARELDVDAVIEGSVLQVGNRVRINVQLIHPQPERHLWTGSYERDMSAVLALHGEVARTVAREIKLTLTAEEKTRLGGGHSVDRSAHEAYLRGRYHWNKRTAENIHKAIQYLEQSVALDPEYALAHAGLADAYIVLPDYAATPTAECYPMAKAAATRAIELDPALGEAYAARGMVSMVYDYDWAAAERDFKRALELNPGNATAHQWYGRFLRIRGDDQQSIAVLNRARQLDPLSPIINVNVAYSYFLAGQYDRTTEHCRRTLELEPSFAPAHACLGYAYTQKQMYDEAIAAFQEAFALSGESRRQAELGYAFAVAGQREAALRILAQLQARAEREYVEAYDRAFLHAALGNEEQAFRWLDQAYQERGVSLSYLAADPWFDSLRSNPRFQDLLRRLNFPD